MEFPERFTSKFVPEPNTGCWLWTAQASRDGYGKFKYDGGQLAHRFAYEVAKGPIPDGLRIDHLCRQRCCVNPDHLEAVTHRENVIRGLGGMLKTHCPHGHEYTAENTQINHKGARVCRTCRTLEWQRRRPPVDPALRYPKKELCKRGHRMDDNPIVHRNGKRQCRECVNENRRNRRSQERA